MRSLIDYPGSFVYGCYVLFYFESFVNCLIAIRAAYMKKRRFVVFGTILCLFSVFCTMTIKNSWIHGPNENVGFFLYLTSLPEVLWIGILCFVFVLTMVLGIMVIHWEKSNVSAASIKPWADTHPAGIGFFHQSGRMLFANESLNRISKELTGHQPLNGYELMQAFGEETIQCADGTLWSCLHRQFSENDHTFHELILTENTELLQQKWRLEEVNMQLYLQKQKLWEYQTHIDEVVREKEILEAKIRIHDEMNRLLTITEEAFAKGDSERQALCLKAWQECIQLMRIGPTEDFEAVLSSLTRYGEMVGVEFCCSGLPEGVSDRVKRLFVKYSSEALTNAAKHANATHLFADFRELEFEYRFVYTNDGIAPNPDKVKPVGGLKHIQTELERLGGVLELNAAPDFRLTITIPKGEVHG